MLEISGIGVLTAFAAGMISFLSPCVLPLVPAYLSYITGRSVDQTTADGEDGTARMISLSVLFVLGFSLVFITLGASATALSRLLLAYKNEASMVGGTIVLVFGLFMTGLLKLSWLTRDLRYRGRIVRGTPYAAFGLGVAFAFGWTPCIGPVLGAILTVSAVSPQVGSGIALLGIYSLGLGVPFIAAALFTGIFVARMRLLSRMGRPLSIGAGAVMIVMGIAMITGYMTTFSYWMLRTFPVFGQIG
jgi:cytochrome c-type biogenesis protein